MVNLTVLFPCNDVIESLGCGGDEGDGQNRVNSSSENENSYLKVIRQEMEKYVG